MSIDSLSTVASTATVAAPTASTGIGADFNMFLKLLTTQMQNQDPLSPMDSAAYTQQLVQFSQVEQTVQQTGTLKDILASLSSQGMMQASGFIGRDAVFDSTTAGLGATPATWNYTADRATTSATMTITNAAGKVVDTRTVALDGTSGSYSWDGLLADGTTAAKAGYTLSIKAVDAAGATVATTVQATGRISDVSAKNGVVSLGVNGVSMSLDSLVRLAAVEA